MNTSEIYKLASSDMVYYNFSYMELFDYEYDYLNLISECEQSQG